MLKKVVTIALLWFTLGAHAHHDLGSVLGCTQGGSNGFIPLTKGRLLVQTVFEFEAYKAFDLDYVDRYMHSGWRLLGLDRMYASTLGLQYGITNRISVSANIPLYYAMLHEYTMPYTTLLDSIKNTWRTGDASTMAHFQVLKSANGFGLTLSAGVELPAGRPFNEQQNNLLVAGSGSYDPMFGVELVKSWKSILWSGRFLYKRNGTSSEGYKQGDLMSGETWLAFQPQRQKAADSIVSQRPIKMKWLVGARWQQFDASFFQETQMPNTGFMRIAVSGGLQVLVNQKIYIPLTISVPVCQELTGLQNWQQFRVSTGVSVMLFK